MAKRGRPKLWENCSAEEQEEVREIEISKYQLIVDFAKGNLTKRQYHNRRKKLLNRIDEVEVKYEL